VAKIAVASNYSLNMSDFDFSAIYYGSSYVQSGTLFRVNYSDGTVEEFRGTGFKYNAYGEPIAGTVTSYAAFYGGQQLFNVEGGSIAATKIVAAAQTSSTSDDAGVIIEILRGNDTITGGNIADVLFGFDGNDVVNGNGGDDILYGHDGNDTLVGGAGLDQMRGGEGNDTYLVDNVNDAVIEWETGGIDTVRSAIAFNLGNVSVVKGSVENLVLLGSANINGTGNSLNNTLVGNSGNNAFNGGQGDDLLAGLLGNDTLIGASGYDVFLFNTALNAASNVDTIADFSVPTDTIKLENSIFTKIAGLGTLTAAQFVKNTSGTAVDASDRIIYETDTGKLFYDSNGNAAGGSIHFATLANKAAITNLDFFVV
jgi:Ca2+-binding RTX toxin-like protein